jgi:hypothetical protein
MAIADGCGLLVHQEMGLVRQVFDHCRTPASFGPEPAQLYCNSAASIALGCRNARAEAS